MDSTTKTLCGWTGYLLHFLLAGVMVLSGGMKLVVNPDEMPGGEETPQALKDHLIIIGVGEITSGLLLLSPATLPPAMVLCSAFWGGAIMAHLPKGESYLLQTAFLLVCWIGAALRRPDLVLPFVNEPEAPQQGHLPGSEPPPA